MAFRKVRDFLYVVKEKNVVREGLEMAFLTLKVFCGLHVANKYLFTIVLPYGPSMLPTLSLNGNLILAERVSTRFGLVGPGDIVLVRSPLHPTLVVTKRLIGLEGDSVSYVVEPGKSDRTDTIVVPKGHVWVEGDNIYASRDSRNFGPVPYGLLEGKFIWRIWPPKDFGSLRPNKTEPILDKDQSSTEAI